MEGIAPQCINVVLNFKIADILKEHPDGMDIAGIGEKSGADPEKIGRILRLLATRHIFREGEEFPFTAQAHGNRRTPVPLVSNDVFANNRLSIQLLSNNPISSLGLHLYVFL